MRAVAIFVVGCAAQLANASCVATLAGLLQIAGDPPFALRWTEKGMSDGKPLILAIMERDGLLHLRFDKTGEGLWAEGTSLVCVDGGNLVAHIDAASIRPGPAAPWLLRQSLAGGARFELVRPAPGTLRVSTPGWRGLFAADGAAVTRR